MEDVKVSNLDKLYTMILLYEKPRHGYQIIKNTGEKLGKKMSPGEIYPFLGMLEKRGLVTSRETGAREKKTYSLTPSGKKFAMSLLEKFGEIVHAAVESRLKKCHHCGCEIYRGGFAKRGKVFCCRACSDS